MTKAIILVVDDSSDNLLFLDTLLQGSNYQVKTASSGEVALDILKTESPDLILLDINMPGIGGLETCRTIRSNENFGTLPIIFLSGMAGIEEQEQVNSVGGDGLIGKPYSLVDLLGLIESHIKPSSSAHKPVEKNIFM